MCDCTSNYGTVGAVNPKHYELKAYKPEVALSECVDTYENSGVAIKGSISCTLTPW